MLPENRCRTAVELAEKTAGKPLGDRWQNRWKTAGDHWQNCRETTGKTAGKTVLAGLPNPVPM